MGATPTFVALFYFRPLFYLFVEIWHNTKTNTTFRLLLRTLCTFASPQGVATTSFQSGLRLPREIINNVFK